MPVITVALMGFFAFSGIPTVTPEAPLIAEAGAVATTTIALAQSVEMSPVSSEAIFVKLTSYNAVPEQTDADPTVTASGARTNPQVVAARSVDLSEELPFGTIVEITREGTDSSTCRFGAVEHLIGYRVIADSMHSRKRAQVDILLDERDTISVNGTETNPSVTLGVCSGVSVRPIGKIDIARMPNTQEELRMIVEGDALAINR